MKQQSLASQSVYEKYGRKSRRELFLDEMEQIVPWTALESVVRPHYAKAGKGRQPVGLSIKLRTYFVQQWFNLPISFLMPLTHEDLGSMAGLSRETVSRLLTRFRREGLVDQTDDRMTLNQPRQLKTLCG
jgi:CRP-like cAMP-binding protein